VKEQVLDKKKPMLGICVGMQVLANTGFEGGEHEGLGWISGVVKKIETNLFLPHIGWNNLMIQNESPLTVNLGDDSDFYFVNNYVFCADNPENRVAGFDYDGVHSAIVAKENIFGVQFHPEKSQSTGVKLISNFLEV
jgi:glutamine amidotransferase